MHRIRVLGAACVLALMASLAIAAPAQADPLAEQYAMVTNTGAQTGVFWVDEEQRIIGCTQCLHWFDVRTSVVLDPRTQASVHTAIITGLTDLSDTIVTTDPGRIASLRAAALAQFTAGAQALGRAAASPGPVGSYNPATRATTVINTPWLAAADQDIANGLNDLKTPCLDPQPCPWVTAGVAQFDAAYLAISEKRVPAGS